MLPLLAVPSWHTSHRDVVQGRLSALSLLRDGTSKLKVMFGKDAKTMGRNEPGTETLLNPDHWNDAGWGLKAQECSNRSEQRSNHFSIK